MTHVHDRHPGTTIVLAAHGATDDPRCAAPVHRHAEAIRKLDRFDEVLTIFWKESPHFRDLYELTTAEEIIVVPVMTASGYYSRTILPRELSMNALPLNRHVYISEAIGEFVGMTDIITEQAMRISVEHGVNPSEARVLLIGHGTRRDPVRSGATTRRHADRLAAQGFFQDVHVGFLEQDPEVRPAFDAIPGKEPVIIVPFLIANGGHGADDIPRDLCAQQEARTATVNRRTILFADAVGEHPRTVDLILQSAQATFDMHHVIA